ncbi:hypothetical protein L9F63_020773, partial [Diploptera punctata]
KERERKKQREVNLPKSMKFQLIFFTELNRSRNFLSFHSANVDSFSAAVSTPRAMYRSLLTSFHMSRPTKSCTFTKTHQVSISRSPHLYMSPSSHCDDIKAMNNFLPSTLEYVFWNVLNSLYDALTKITKVFDWGGVNFIFDIAPEKEIHRTNFIGPIRTLCRFTLPDKWKVASSEKKIL